VELELRSERALAFVYDLRFNTGNIRPQAIEQDRRDRETFVKKIGRPPDEQERLMMLATRSIRRLPPAFRENAFMRTRRYTFALGRGTLGGVPIDLELAGFGMRDVDTRAPIPLSGDAATLKQLESGWLPGDAPQ
jgi:hypothetical protein